MISRFLPLYCNIGTLLWRQRFSCDSTHALVTKIMRIVNIKNCIYPQGCTSLWLWVIILMQLGGNCIIFVKNIHNKEHFPGYYCFISTNYCQFEAWEATYTSVNFTQTTVIVPNIRIVLQERRWLVNLGKSYNLDSSCQSHRRKEKV